MLDFNQELVLILKEISSNSCECGKNTVPLHRQKDKASTARERESFQMRLF
jgi:hypothetical protein